MKGITVVFASRTGHAREMAGKLAALIGTDAREIGDKVNRKGVFGFILAGYQAASGKASPIVDPGVDLKDAQTVVIVEPVWASSVVPPVRTWLRAHASEVKGKKLAVLVTNMGSPMDKFKMKFEAEFGPLSAFSGVAQSESPEIRESRIREFAEAVKAL